jgi:predicted RNase H-like HicB family nuclease
VLEGYNTWGKTYEEAIKHAEEALTLHLESFDELGKSILEERSLKQPTPSG